MSIYIASMKMRSYWAEKPPNTTVINVTSMQGKKSNFRRDFSPLSAIEGRYKGFYCFENYWQAYKRYDYLDHLTDETKRNNYVKWWTDLNYGKRKHKLTKNPPVDAKYEDNIVRNYIDARKNIYVKQYYDLIVKTESFEKCKKMLEEGKDLVIYDFDGPKDENGKCICLKVDLKMLKQKINDTSYPFGHGYVIAAALKGYKPTHYC